MGTQSSHRSRPSRKETFSRCTGSMVRPGTSFTSFLTSSSSPCYFSPASVQRMPVDRVATGPRVALSLFLHLRRHLRYRPHPDICTGGAHNQGIEWIAHVEGLDLSRGKELPRVLEHGVE